MSRLDDRIAAQHRERELRELLPSPAKRRRLRERAGVSQEDVALSVGVTREAVTRWEAGTRTPRGRILDRYVAVLQHLKAAEAEGQPA